MSARDLIIKMGVNLGLLRKDLDEAKSAIKKTIGDIEKESVSKAIKSVADKNRMGNPFKEAARDARNMAKSLIGAERATNSLISKLLTTKINITLRGLRNIAIAAIGAAYAIKKMFDPFISDQGATARLQSVIDRTGGVSGFNVSSIKYMASQLQSKTGFDDTEIIDAATILSTNTNVREGIFKQALESAIDLSVVLQQDLKTSILQISKALENPIEGMQALRRIGVFVSDDMENQIKKLILMGDLQGAQLLVLEKLRSKGIAGAGEAFGKSLEGQFARIKASISDIFKAVGANIFTSNVLNYTEKLVQLIQMIPDYVNTISSGLSVLGQHIGQIGSYFGDLIGLASIFKDITDSIAIVWDWLADLFQALADNIASEVFGVPTFKIEEMRKHLENLEKASPSFGLGSPSNAPFNMPDIAIPNFIQTISTALGGFKVGQPVFNKIATATERTANASEAALILLRSNSSSIAFT